MKIKFDAAQSNIQDAFGISPERFKHLRYQLALIFHDAHKPQPDDGDNDGSYNLNPILEKAMSLAETPEELALVSFVCGRRIGYTEE